MGVIDTRSETSVHEVADGIHRINTLAASQSTTLACMHTSAWQGAGATLLRALADALDA